MIPDRPSELLPKAAPCRGLILPRSLQLSAALTILDYSFEPALAAFGLEGELDRAAVRD